MHSDYNAPPAAGDSDVAGDIDPAAAIVARAEAAWALMMDPPCPTLVCPTLVWQGLACAPYLNGATGPLAFAHLGCQVFALYEPGRLHLLSECVHNPGSYHAYPLDSADTLAHLLDVIIGPALTCNENCRTGAHP
jgi:hypothetical protein